MEILGVAEVQFCDPITEYSYQWVVEGLESEEVKRVKGNSLTLSRGIFEPGKSLILNVTVLNNESMAMASVSTRNIKLLVF